MTYPSVPAAAQRSYASQIAPSYAATGLTGATAGARFAGGTTSGAPGSGSFAPGDFAVDQTGAVWICTAAGSPGTWTSVGGGLSAFLCAPAQYAPSAEIIIETTSNVFASASAAATTVASGSNGGEISTVASWSNPSSGVLDVASTAGWPTVGTVNVAASGSTTAVVTYGGITATSLTGCAYVSGSATGTVATGGAVTLTTAGASSAVPAISTGSFTAPPSGDVLVTVSMVATCSSSSDNAGFALAAHGTVTPIEGTIIAWKLPSSWSALSLSFLVTGLTAGNSYNFDLLYAVAAAGTLSIYALGATGTTISGTVGAPVLMTVQAV